MKKIIFILIFLIITTLYFHRKETFYDFKGYAIGTYYSIRVADEVKRSEVNNVILAEIDNVTFKMSHFKIDSELSRLNGFEVDEWFAVSDDLFEVLLKSQEIYKASNNYFDPAIAELIDLWGFGVKNILSFPKEDEIKQAKSKSGFDSIEFDIKNKKIRKKKAVRINLSAIAKGYLVDRIAKHFISIGLQNYLIEVGGETIARGYRNSMIAEKWRVGIEKPTDKEGLIKIINIKDICVATSGDYRNFFEYEGKHYSHTIDPKTGYSVTHNVVSASVFNDSCMTADAYATAILAMGKDKALDWIEKNNLAVILYFRIKKEGFEEYISNKAWDYIK